MRALILSCLGFTACSTGFRTEVADSPVPVVRWSPAVHSKAVGADPDDAALWIHPTDPSQSTVVVTNKIEAPHGAIVVLDLNGKILQTITGVDRPNNIDIRQGVTLGKSVVDLAVATERYRSALRIFVIDPETRHLTEAASPRVFTGEPGEFAAPMGVALYKRPFDGTLYVIVGRKAGPADGYLWQYRVEPGFSLKVVRKFGKFSGRGEIEAIAVDDSLGFVYYADEVAGLRKYAADPDAPGAANELALFGTEGYQGDREGLAIYTTGPAAGYLISTDQIPNSSRYLLYDRQNPDHPLAVIEGGADETDGIEATSASLGPAFPRGILVAMNSGRRNFLFYEWKNLPVPKLPVLPPP